MDPKIASVYCPRWGFVPSTDVPIQSQYTVPSVDRVCTVYKSDVVETPIQPEPPKTGSDPTLSKAKELLNRRSAGPDPAGKKVVGS